MNEYMQERANMWMSGDPRIETVTFQNNYAPLVHLKGRLSDYEAEKRRKDSGVSETAKELTLETYQPMTPTHVKAIQEVKNYHDTFKSDMLPRVQKNGLFIHGSNGTGKTFITWAIANSLMKKFDVQMGTTVAMNDRIRRSEFEDGATSNRWKDKYKYVDILIIDDIGKQQLNEYQANNLFEIIDHRSSNLMPTIFTSNYGSQGLMERLTPDGSDQSTASSIIDRLNGMCKFIEMKGDSLRQ